MQPKQVANFSYALCRTSWCIARRLSSSRRSARQTALFFHLHNSKAFETSSTTQSQRPQPFLSVLFIFICPTNQRLHNLRGIFLEESELSATTKCQLQKAIKNLSTTARHGIQQNSVAKKSNAGVSTGYLLQKVYRQILISSQIHFFLI